MSPGHRRPPAAAAAATFGLAVLLAATLAPVLPAQPAFGADHERLLNGGFDDGKDQWWSSGNTPTEVIDGRLCAEVPGGTTNPWDALIGQNDVPLEQDQPYRLRFTASASRPVTIVGNAGLAGPPHSTALSGRVEVGTSPRPYEIAGTAKVGAAKGQVAFQLGGVAEPYTLCLDDISFTGGIIPPGAIGDLGSPVRVNQHGYLVAGPKRATIVTDDQTPRAWRLIDDTGRSVAGGKTSPFGDDAMSGDAVQLADFSRVRRSGTYRLKVGDDLSEPFMIGTELYAGLRRDALAYFYHNRSGTPIEAKYVGAEYARAAGHVGVAPNQGDLAVGCAPGACDADQDRKYDVRGGWYDAGDHGKYVVNGALAAWQLIDSYEESGDVALAIPERGGALPDLLDEARWQLEFLLRMQRDDGLVFHKIHDAAWTGVPLRPADDPQTRLLYPPSTAATLNLAAVGARCARVYQRHDPAFAARCLEAAGQAWQAALEHPDLFAPAGGVGGGPYDDTTVDDEFSWAAAELFAATGDRAYLARVTTRLTADNFSWRDTGGLADLALLRVPKLLDPATEERVTAHVIETADRHLADQRSQGYPTPFLPADGQYVWGSNSAVANEALVLAYAYRLSHRAAYRDGALEALDYLLGRNALNQSYVTGYGERSSHNQHHRFWGHQLDPSLPQPPPGSLAGGPNSGLDDPVARRALPGRAPAKSYVDDIGSYSTNEVAINWNSALAWLAAFADTVR